MANEDIVVSIGGDDSNFRRVWEKLNADIKSSAAGASGANVASILGSDATVATKSLSNFSATVDTLSNGNLPRLRYALYDIASISSGISQNFLGAAGSVISAGMEYESAFTGVERVTQLTGDEANILRSQLMALAEQIPLTFKDLAGIAQLGSQLGIDNDYLTTFTKTVAEFSSVSGLTAEATAQSFGSLGQVLGFTAAEYNNFGSAVSAAANSAAATEQQILSVSAQISGTAASAGYSADQVVGLATALASLQIPAEQSRGALIRTFAGISQAIVKNGSELETFSKLMGMTKGEITNLAQTNMPEFFNRLTASMAGMNQVQAQATLRELGLEGVYVSNVLTKLANNQDLVTKSMQISSDEYNKGTYLANAFAKTVDDLQSKLQILKSTFQNLSANIATGLIPILGVVLDVFTNVLKGYEAFASTPLGSGIMAVGVVLAGLVGIVFTVITGFALFTAGLFAANTALDGLVADGILPADWALTKILGSLFGVDVASMTTTGQIALLTAQFESGQIGLYQYMAGLQAVEAAEYGVAGGATVLKFAIASTGIGIAVLALGSLAAGLYGAATSTDNTVTSLDNMKDAQGRTKKEVDDLNKGIDAQNAELMKLGGGGGTADKAAAKLRTLSDYAKDLSSVWSRAFEIRFSGQTALDAITKSFSSIAKATADARQEINSLTADIASLSADKALQEYFLGVATAYGDTLAVGKINANLAKINSDLAAKSTNLAAAQDKTNKTLIGNSDAAVANRAEIVNLVSQYESYLQALAASGMSQADLNIKAEELRASFVAQATQMGYNIDELATYTAGFNDVKVAIDNVPRNITIEADVDPAITALREFAAEAAQQGANAGSNFASSFQDMIPKEIFIPVTTQPDKKSVDFWGNLGHDILIIADWISGASYRTDFLPLWATGGFTGRGGKYEPAGIVHKGEYVVPKEQVNQTTGLPYMMQTPKFFSGVTTNNITQMAPSIVSLSPEDRALLRNVGGSGNIVLYADGKELARTVNDGNRQIVAQGGRP